MRGRGFDTRLYLNIYEPMNWRGERRKSKSVAGWRSRHVARPLTTTEPGLGARPAASALRPKMGGRCSSPLNGRQRRYLRGKKGLWLSPLLFFGGVEIQILFAASRGRAPLAVSALLPHRKAASTGFVLTELTFGLGEM